MEKALETAEAKNGAVAVDKKGRIVAKARETEQEIHPLRHASMNLIDEIAHLRGGGAWQRLDQEEDNMTSNSDSDYLLTGMDVYLKREPCLMCAMALVHSRVSRIFYSEAAPRKGGLQSKARVQTIRDLNHAFQVYRMTRPGMPT